MLKQEDLETIRSMLTKQRSELMLKLNKNKLKKQSKMQKLKLQMKKTALLM